MSGLEVVSHSKPKALVNAARELRIWQEKGFAGEMQYMQRDSELFVDLQNLLPGIKTLITFTIAYSQAKRTELQSGYGRVARYAWGRDYHKVIKKRLKSLVKDLEEYFGGVFEHKIFTDAVPLLERAYALESGLGFIGKNTMVITPKRGSFFFLAEILVSFEVDDHSRLSVIGDCKTCTRCLDNCPTNAFESEYQLDARKCISYLTIEKKGVLDLWEREALGEWIFGCDVCQDVCPFNHASLKEERVAEDDRFEKEHGAGDQLKLSEILALRDEKQFVERFAGTPLMRAGRVSLLRNAAVVAANLRSYQSKAALEIAYKDDSSEIVREHAAWALDHL